MHIKKTYKAFSLIELLVVIAIISIIALGITSVDFNRMTQKQELEIELIKITSMIEEARNNALIGRSISGGSDIADSWTIAISESSSGSILQGYNVGGANSPLSSWQATNGFSLNGLSCQRLDGSVNPISGTGTLIFTGTRGSINGCPDDYYKKLRFNIALRGVQKSVEINALTGVIEVF